MAKGQAGGTLAGKGSPMLVNALTTAAAIAGQAAERHAGKSENRLIKRGISAGERSVGNYIDSKSSVLSIVRPVAQRPPPADTSMFGDGILGDLQSAAAHVPVAGKCLRRGLAPAAAAEYLAEEGMRVGRDAANVYNAGRRTRGGESTTHAAWEWL